MQYEVKWVICGATKVNTPDVNSAIGSVCDRSYEDLVKNVDKVKIIAVINDTGYPVLATQEFLKTFVQPAAGGGNTRMCCD